MVSRMGAFGHIRHRSKIGKINNTGGDNASAQKEPVDTGVYGESLNNGGDVAESNNNLGTASTGSSEGAGLLTKRADIQPAQQNTKKGLDELGKKVKRLQGEPNAYIGEQTGVVVLG